MKQYKPYKDPSITAEKYRELQAELPSMLKALRALPQADGTEDQAQEAMAIFYKHWSSFRIKAMKCGQKAWLDREVYADPAWKNYEALKHQSSHYRGWKKEYNRQAYRSMSVDDKEAKLAKQRESYQKTWWDTARLYGLAQRVLKANPDAKTVPAVGPVTRLMVKHCNLTELPRRVNEVAMYICILRFKPTDPSTLEDLQRAVVTAGLAKDWLKILEAAKGSYEDRSPEDKAFDLALKETHGQAH